MKRIGILYHPKNEAAYGMSQKLEKFLNSWGVSVWLCSAWEGQNAREQVEETDLILSIGGDGTILRSAQAVVPGLTPITGINMGNLGFMTELSVDETIEKLELLLEGKGWIDERCLLEAEITAPDKSNAPGIFYALNDVVVARGEIARVIRIEASIDDEPLTTYKADGVIVATATGSTGYSLAAGGPILHPRAGEFLLLPIMPHLSSSYTLVLPSTTTVRLKINTVHPATVNIDGHINMSLLDDTIITVKRSPHIVRFLRIHPRTAFYSSLEERLKGKK